MTKSRETFGKKENEKLQLKKRQEKEEKKKKRKEKGKASFEDMIAYVDAYGRLSSVPPDTNIKEIAPEDILLGATPIPDEPESKELVGIVVYYNDAKGFGFIKDDKLETYFMHASALLQPVKIHDRVSFEFEHSQKGKTALKVKLIPQK